jgi:hypothetical protein
MEGSGPFERGGPIRIRRGRQDAEAGEIAARVTSGTKLIFRQADVLSHAKKQATRIAPQATPYLLKASGFNSIPNPGRVGSGIFPSTSFISSTVNSRLKTDSDR